MRIIIFKILASLSFGMVVGGIVISVILHSPAGREFQAVTLEDLVARRELNERVAAALDGKEVALPTTSSRITLLAVGDVMMSRVVADRMRENGVGYPFVELQEELDAANITFGNLESPITEGRHIGATEMVFRADPETATELSKVGFDVLSLANNHVMNFGAAGLEDTVRHLDDAGIQHVGAGLNGETARQAAIIERGDLSFAFLGYTYSANSLSAGAVPLDVGIMREDIAGVRSQVDFVIVSMHAGTEYAQSPNDQQVEFAHAAIDAGADVVLGHHPHVVQTVEEYNGKYIFYSLGNFVFDQMWSWETRRGLGVRLIFSEDGVEEVEYVPVIIDDYAKPRLASEHEAASIMNRLGSSYLTLARETHE